MFSCFHGKIYLKQWLWWISSWLSDLIITKTVILITILKKLFLKACFLNFFSDQDSFFVKHIKFEKPKELKQEISEQLMPNFSKNGERFACRKMRKKK